MIRLPSIDGLIRRRILLSYRVDPEVMQRHLPSPFTPQLVDGHAIAGMCLIRLERLRPGGVPSVLGLSSENAAHRVAVNWTDSAGTVRQGVYVLRRDTDSALSVMAGGCLFPGEYRRAQFVVRDRESYLDLTMASADGAADVRLQARASERLSGSSVFPSARAATDFFAAGSIGFSAAADGGRPEALELCACEWIAQPLEVESLTSAYYDDPRRFPPNCITFDSALIVRDLPHRWQRVPLDVRLP